MDTFLIGVTRFELATSASRTLRSTKLSHTPKVLYILTTKEIVH